MLRRSNKYISALQLRCSSICLSLTFIIVVSCTSIPPINISLEDVQEAEKYNQDTTGALHEETKDVEASIQKLKSSIQDNQDEKLVADIMLMLEARLEHSKANYNEAIKYWIEALKQSQSKLSIKAFSGLVQSVKASAKGMNQEAVSEQIYNLTREQKIPFMKDNNLSDIERIKNYIGSNELILGVSFNEETTGTEPGVKDNQLDKDKDSQVKKEKNDTIFDVSTDPYLKRATTLYCKKQDRKDSSYWERAEADLDSFYKIYWKGIKSECDKQTDEAIKAFSYIITKYVDDKSKNVGPKIALNSGLHLVNLYKLKGNRLLMSYTWSAIVKIYDMGVGAKDLGIDQVAFELQKIDHYLWTARYLAIAHDYNGATKITNKSLEFIKKLQKTKLSSKDKRQANIFEAEAYSVLASRIKIEEKKYKEAIDYVTAIKNISLLPSSWKERVDWNLALYTYLDGKYKEASDMMVKLLNNPDYKSNESRYLYWLYKIYSVLENQEEASYYFNQLIDKYPFSFYSVYSAYDKKNSHLAEYFTYNNSIKSYYLNSEEYSLVLDSKAKSLLRRHELVLLSSLGEYYDITSMEFYSYFKRKYKLSSKSFEDYLFVAKLLMASGNYIHSISLITELVKFDRSFWKNHPEYIFVYYPRPYMDEYTKEASKRGFNTSVPLAISRQESSFRTQVKSSAGAIGVMQMMPETGIKMYKKLYDKSIDDKTMEQMLKNEKINIELGTYYLYILSKRYNNNLPAVFGGYNAGEYMIDAWLDYRYNKDVVTWIETLPFNETKEYIKNVWRNMMVYDAIFAVQKLEPTVFDVEDF